jgi:hypothetical protein
MVRLDSGTTAPCAVGLWVTDGTEAGTQKLLNGYGTWPANNYNGTFYFQNYTSAVGYVPFYYAVPGPKWHTGSAFSRRPRYRIPEPFNRKF